MGKMVIVMVNNSMWCMYMCFVCMYCVCMCMSCMGIMRSFNNMMCIVHMMYMICMGIMSRMGIMRSFNNMMCIMHMVCMSCMGIMSYMGIILMMVMRCNFHHMVCVMSVRDVMFMFMPMKVGVMHVIGMGVFFNDVVHVRRDVVNYVVSPEEQIFTSSYFHRISKSRFDVGEFHDQEDAKWIVIKG
jgi:hypothetical protein